MTYVAELIKAKGKRVKAVIRHYPRNVVGTLTQVGVDFIRIECGKAMMTIPLSSVSFISIGGFDE